MEDSAFHRFVQTRRLLNERLEPARADIDKWLAHHPDGDADINSLAQLEFLLQTRRELLAELAALDDAFMNHLLIRRRNKQDGVSAPSELV